MAGNDTIEIYYPGEILPIDPWESIKEFNEDLSWSW